MTNLKSSKEFRDYECLVDLLIGRGMIVPDRDRAIRKLSQIGYYRLSGFWYPCREGKKGEDGRYLTDIKTQLPIREDTFQPDVSFDDIVHLYLIDKKIRQLMLDAIERIEIQLRTCIAHALGYNDPLAYEKDEYINPTQKKNWYDKNGNLRNVWIEWSMRHNDLISRSKEDSLIWHKLKNKEIPIWVAVESWDFGLTSKYYEIILGKYQEIISKKMGVIDKKCLINWLQTINTLRNRCAHHSRIWNRSWSSPLRTDRNLSYFNELKLDEKALRRTYGIICVIWYLVKTLGPSSDWLERVADVVDSKPVLSCCPFGAMGFPDETGFPREKFSLPPKKTY